MMSCTQSSEDPDRNYLVVTPAKDEEENLPRLMDSIANQSIKPALWVIVDDGSTDDTPRIITDATTSREWIRSIRLPPGERYWGFKYSTVCRKGFDQAMELAEEEGIPYSYISLVDADMVLEGDYFSKLLEKFETMPRLGIASGELYSRYKDRFILEKERHDIPSGGQRVWRRECFEECPYTPSYSADSVSNVRAKLKGWEIRRFRDVRALQSRRTRGAEGFWKGWHYVGKSEHYRGCSPSFALLKGIKLLFSSPHYQGFAYWKGYFGSFLRREEKIPDKAVIDYYRHTRPQEIKAAWSRKSKRTSHKVDK